MARAERRLFTIPPDRPFVDDLAAGLMARATDPLDLARTLVLLPNRRAARALSSAFLRLAAASGKDALLLPRLAPVGDLEPGGQMEDMALGSFADSLEGDDELLPAIDPLERQLLLMQLLLRDERDAAEAHALAGQLAAALDALEIEGISAADLGRIDPAADLQAHWEKSLAYLQLIMRRWPALLRERGRLDLTRRRNLLLARLAQRWRRERPHNQVVIAGFAAAPPVVARLMAAVAGAPRGAVVLPGFDTSLGAEAWDAIRGTDAEPAVESHPQYGFARLLEAMRAVPSDVEDWPHRDPSAPAAPPERTALVRRAMTPAALTGDPVVPDPGAVAGVRFLEAATPAEEALAVAIAVRQALRTPDTRIAVVTPDRALARRIAVQLCRFEIDADDSAGTPLTSLPAGALIVALAQAFAERFAPRALLALLKHTLVHAGDGRQAWLDDVRALDRLALRGPRPRPGLAPVAERIAIAREEARDDPARDTLERLTHWWRYTVEPPLADLDALAAEPRITLDSVLAALTAAADALTSGAAFAGPAGRALADRLGALDARAADTGRIIVDREEVPQLVSAMLRDVSCNAEASHPQVVILGPLEARLQRADLTILAGLNEGVWPQRPAPDPWLAPAARRQLDLPGLARRTGLMAHDFAQAMGAPEVLLTRAARDGAAPTVPSRFWQRVLAEVTDPAGAPPLDTELVAAARRIDRPDGDPRPATRPAPSPPASARPRSLSVTEVSRLKADPFAFYARRILRLDPLDPLDSDPTAADLGTLVHKALERWVTDPAARARGIAAIADEELAKLPRPELTFLWRPRLLRRIGWATDQLDALLAPGAPWRVAAAEVRGSLKIGGITLKGKPDRIDADPAGNLRITDYKTGAAPSVGDVEALFDAQLPLLAVMAQEGGFGAVRPGPVTELEYWTLPGGATPGSARPALGKQADPAAVPGLIDRAREDLLGIARDYLLGERPFRSKELPAQGVAYSDYDVLARLAEWYGR